MASLFSRVAKLANSPQGRQALDRAKAAANDPKNKEKVNGLLSKVRGGAGTKQQPPTGGPVIPPTPPTPPPTPPPVTPPTTPPVPPTPPPAP